MVVRERTSRDVVEADVAAVQAAVVLDTGRHRRGQRSAWTACRSSHHHRRTPEAFPPPDVAPSSTGRGLLRRFLGGRSLLHRLLSGRSLLSRFLGGGASSSTVVSGRAPPPSRTSPRRRDPCWRRSPARSMSSVRSRTRTRAGTQRTWRARALGAVTPVARLGTHPPPPTVSSLSSGLWTGPTPYGEACGPLPRRYPPHPGGHHRANGLTSLRTDGVVRSEGFRLWRKFPDCAR